MEFRPLGRTGVQVSALCLGCMNFGGRAGAAESAQIIHQALDAGVNFLDTADVYGHDPGDFASGRGRSEEIVGAALRARGGRDRVVLATKAHFPMGDDPNAGGSSRRHLIAACEASLRRLQTDHIDLYQLHHPTNEVPIDETLQALDDLVRAGKVRYIGTSSFAAWQIVEALWAARDLRLNRAVSEQPAYNLLDRRIERELVPMAQTYGLALLPWSPTAGGFLAGRYAPGAPPPGDSRFATFWRGEEARYTAPAHAVLAGLAELAASKGCSPAQLALAWCMGQPGITSPIIGPRTPAQLSDALDALNVALIAEDRAALDVLAPPGRATVPYYGADGLAWTTWGPHRHHWR